MCDADGWVKLHRCVRNSWQMSKSKWWFAWSWMIMNAAWKEGNGLLPGQFLWSSRKMCKEWEMTERQAREFIHICLRRGDVVNGFSTKAAQNRHKLSLYFIVKWDTYQEAKDANPTQTRQEPDTKPTRRGKKQNKIDQLQAPKKEEVRSKKEEDIPSSPSAPDGRDAHEEPKERTPFQQFTDHIWETYEVRYGTKPITSGGTMPNLVKAFKAHGSEIMIAAWDHFIHSDDQWYCDKSHSLSLFVAGGVLGQIVPKVVKRSRKPKEPDYIMVNGVRCIRPSAEI